jgi:hypothetical protein
MEKSMSEENIVDVEYKDVPKIPEEFAVETDETRRETRLLDLMKPINQTIESCQNRADILLIASAMMHTSRDLFMCELGEESTKVLFSNLKFVMPVDNETQDS